MYLDPNNKHWIMNEVKQRHFFTEDGNYYDSLISLIYLEKLTTISLYIKGEMFFLSYI